MPSPPEYAINVAKTEFREGYNTGDVGRILSVISDSCSNMSDGMPSFYGAEGKAAFGIEAERLLHHYDVKLEVASIAITVFGTTGLQRGWHKFTLKSKSDHTTEIRHLRFCEVWKQESDCWRIAFFMSNPESAPQMLEDWAASFSI